MQLVMNEFENVANKGKTHPDRPVLTGVYFNRSTLVQNSKRLGRVDAMMKSNFKTIVSAYAKEMKTGEEEGFTPGPVTIEINVSDNMCGPSRTIILTGTLVR
jgi:hypothetical protein